MSIANTMDVLATATGVARHFGWPQDAISPPSAVVGYPELDPEITFLPAKAENIYPVWIILGKAVERTARDALSALVPTVRSGLLAATGTGIDSIRVDSIKIQEVSVGGIDYLAAVFSVPVIEAI